MFWPVSTRIISNALRRLCLAGLTVAYTCLLLSEAVAAPTDFLVDGWDTDKELPSSTVTSIQQTPDGYLWVGTYNGVSRFDGARFMNFDPGSTPELSQTRVQGLFVDVRGTLWINTYRGGLTSYRDGVFRTELPDQATFDLHTTLVQSTSNLVTFVTQFGEVLRRHPTQTEAKWEVTVPPVDRPIFQCVDFQGHLWFLSREGHILIFAAGEFNALPEDGGLSGSKIYTLVADAEGQVFAGAENEIARWDGRQFVAITPINGEADVQPLLIFPTRAGPLWVLDGDRLRKMSGREWVAEAVPWRGLLGNASGRAMGAHEDREGGMWFNHYGNGLFHVTPDGRYQRLTSAENLPGDRVGAWFQSSDGGIWAGVDHGGLARLRDRRFQVLGAADGLGVRTALSVCEDMNGTVWIGTGGGGLCRMQNGKISRYTVGSSVSANFIFSIAPRPDGSVWLSAAEGEDLYQFMNGQIQRVSWDVHGIKSILTDRQGRVWMGTKSGIAQWDGEQRWLLGTNNATTTPAVRALAETPTGEIWAGSDDGTLYRCDQKQLVAFRPKDALADQPIYSLVADAEGTLWAGTFRGGLLRFKNGVFSRITAKQGLPVDVIGQLLEDKNGRLWLGTHKGIYSVSKAALNAIADGRTNSLDYVIYGQHDGLPSVECSDGYQPSCWRGANGRLWFTTVRGGVVSVQPNDLVGRSKPSPVLIEEMRVDGEVVPLSGGNIVIPPGHSQFDFQFTTLSFDAGDKARFRYRLEQYDADWVNADTLRTAHYGRLPPHKYRFRVIACNNEGVWNEAGAMVEFELQPFFYQTVWFNLLASALVIAVVAFTARRLATQKYRRKLARLQQQHAIERDRARIAKDIHDDVGAGLTQITLLTELARREPEQTNANLNRITDSARQLTKAMDEIVWAVDPQHDTFAGLLDYVSAYAEDFLRVANIRFRMDVPMPMPELRVDAELRYNLFLALKESLNNTVKHGQATEVWVRLQLAARQFTLVIEDNGRGFEMGGDATGRADRLSASSGLANLEKRLRAVGGRCRIHSEIGRGTRVEMSAPFSSAASPVVAIGREGAGD